MKSLLLIFIFSIICHQVILEDLKVVEKRNSCNAGNCNTCSQGRCNTCNTGGCNTCNNEGCNEAIRPPPCATCVSECTSQCSSNQCVNSCLNDCNCNSKISEPSSPCCNILHPKRCYTNGIGQKRCYIRRHRECSDACTSSVVAIQERPQPGPWGCQRIQNYPYSYCGNYQRLNCGQCYSCNGDYNPRECFQQNDCPDGCREANPFAEVY